MVADNLRLAKGARLPRCGRCDGCTRNDCGNCIPCRDKRKFNGPGVKKQACVMRRCQQLNKRPQGIPTIQYIPPASEPRPLPPLQDTQPAEVPTFDFDDSIDDMHIDTECDFQLLFSLEATAPPAKVPKAEPPRRSLPTSPRAEARRNNSRLHRCGKCVACKGRDCGRCQNCADKPRFGGKGVKKQACVARRCVNLSKRDDDDELFVPGFTGSKPLVPLSDVVAPPPNSSFEYCLSSGKGSFTSAIGSPTGVMDFQQGEQTPPPDDVSSSDFESCAPTWPEGWGEWPDSLEAPSVADPMPPLDAVLPPMSLRPGAAWEDMLGGLTPIKGEPALNLDDWPGWL